MFFPWVDLNWWHYYITLFAWVEERKRRWIEYQESGKGAALAFK